LIGPQSGPLHLLTIDSDNNASLCQISEKRRKAVTDVVWHRDRLFLFDSASVEMIDPYRGAVLAEKDLPPAIVRRNSRFYVTEDCWYGVSHDGSQFVDQYLCRDRVANENIVAVIESRILAEPLLVLSDGTIRSVDDQQAIFERTSCRKSTTIVASSADESRVLVIPLSPSESRSRSRLLIDLREKKTEWTQFRRNWRQDLEPNAFSMIHPMSVRNQFTSVILHQDHLALRCSKGPNLFLDSLDGSGLGWKLDRQLLHKVRAEHQFVNKTSPNTIHYQLSEAVFDDGSRFVLDSRGLLHCQSSDRSIPEFTLVLVEGFTAGWCANGRMFGRGYFLETGNNESTKIFAYEVLRPFLRRLT